MSCLGVTRGGIKRNFKDENFRESICLRVYTMILIRVVCSERLQIIKFFAQIHGLRLFDKLLDS